jgi:decaprenylphospho-beta-D-ribofuranose 2-oxidase
MRISGWGRFPQIDCDVMSMRDRQDALDAVRSQPSLITRGNGRSYGDAALNATSVLSTLKSDRILAFDTTTGTIRCEAGLILSDLLDFAVPRGFFPPVTPGTRFVTLGGMIASDVHGKNHHAAGTFGRHVESLNLLTADGIVHLCSRTENADLLRATCGGMGLTGTILDATFRLLPIETAAIRQEVAIAADIVETMALCESSANWTYTVAWIDCLARGARLGRSVIFKGEHASRDEVGDASLAVPRRRTKRVPVDFPGFALNKWSVRAFNELYYRRSKPGVSFPDYETFFYPLDAIHDWNRIYGGAGFTQYQCVVPVADSAVAIRRILQSVSEAGLGSFLAVLKLFGRGDDGLLSFPMEGYTLTLDFPANSRTFNLLLRLDAILAEYGGRLYLAKDVRGSADMMRRGYPNLDAFRAIREIHDPMHKMASLQSERLGI